MAKTKSNKRWDGGKRTIQPGFATLIASKSEPGRFWFTYNDVMIELPVKIAYRLYKFLKVHYKK